MTLIEALILSTTIVLVLVSPMTGSFLKCWADRAGVGQRVRDGRSYCDSCGKTLQARDLIPILSWAMNGGKSRCCGEPLRWTLMTAEITSLLLAIWAVLVVSPPLLLPALLIAWMLQATALLAVPAPRQATIIGMILSVFALCLAWFDLFGDVQTHLLGFALGLLVALVAWTGATDPGARFLQAATLLPPLGALLGVSGMGVALAIGLLFAALHNAVARALRRDGEPVVTAAASLAFGWAGGAWIIWIYGPSLFSGAF